MMTQHANEIWQQVHDGLRGFVAKRVAERPEVDDILQEGFLRVHRHPGSLKKPEKPALRGDQIPRHEIIDHYSWLAPPAGVPEGVGLALGFTPRALGARPSH